MVQVALHGHETSCHRLEYDRHRAALGDDFDRARCHRGTRHLYGETKVYEDIPLIIEQCLDR